MLRTGNSRTEPGPRLPILVAALLALVFVSIGVVLRFDGVEQQFIGGDEWHAIHVARMGFDYSELFGRHERRDNSVPMTLYARTLMDTIGLTEPRFRLPVMVSAVLLLLCPLCFRRAVGREVAVATVALLATSPLAVYYSIVARPYSPAALLVLVASYSWWSWLKDRSVVHRTAFPLLAALAVVAHLLALLPVLVLFVLALVETVRGRLKLRSLVISTALFAGLCTAFFLPGLETLIGARAPTLAAAPLTLDVLNKTIRPLTGFVEPITWTLGSLILLGSVRLFKTDRLLGLAVPSVLAVQVLALVILRPVGTPSAWPRYLFLVWPLALLAAAAGLHAIATGIGRLLPAAWRPAARGSLTLAAAGVLACAVPVFSPAGLFNFPDSSFRSGKAMVHPTANTMKRVRGQLFEQLTGAPGPPRVILIAPYTQSNNAWAELAAQEQLYGAEFLMADLRIAEARREGLRLRKAVDLADSAEVAALGAEYLILDRRRASNALRREVRSTYGAPVARRGAYELYDLREQTPALRRVDPRSAKAPP